MRPVPTKPFFAARRLSARLSIALLAALCASCVRLADVETLIAQKRYAEAFEDVRLLAKFGDAKAQNTLGWMTENGYGTNKNFEEAAHWYREAALQNLPAAQNNLGLMYLEGRGVARDPAEAARWFQKAVSSSYADALNNLGVLYDHGNGVPQNKAEAARLFEASAKLGTVRAKTNLGVLYKKGEGVPQDLTRARELFEQAAAKQGVRGMTNLAVMLDEGEGGPADRPRAKELFKAAAKLGEAQAAYRLAKSLLGEAEALGKTRGNTAETLALRREAYAWVNLAASMGHTRSLELRDALNATLPKEEIVAAQAISMNITARAEKTSSQR